MANDFKDMNDDVKQATESLMILSEQVTAIKLKMEEVKPKQLGEQFLSLSKSVSSVGTMFSQLGLEIGGSENSIQSFCQKFDVMVAGTKGIIDIPGKAAESFKALDGKLGGIVHSVGQFTGSVSEGTEKVGLLQTIGSAVTAHPYVALGVAVGGLALAFLSCWQQGDSLTQKEKDQIAASRELKKECEELANVQSDLNDRFKNSTDGINADYAVTAEYFSKLLALTGPDGYVGNLEEAKLYVDELNRQGISGISINKEGQLVQEKSTEEYKKQIEQMRVKAMLQANEEAYGNALLKQNEVLHNVSTAQTDVNKAQQDYNDKIEKYVNQGMSYQEAVAEASKQHGQFGTVLNDANKALDEANRSMVENQEAITNQEALVKLTTGSVQEQAQANIDLALSYSNVVGASGEVSYKWRDMQDQLSNYDQAMLDHKSGVKEMSATEIEQNEASRAYLIQCMTDKGISLGTTLDEMHTKLGNTYKNMTAEEKTQFDSQYQNLIDNGTSVGAELARQKAEAIELLKKYNIDVKSEEGKDYLEKLKDYQEHGDSLGRTYLDSLSKELKSEKPKVDIDTSKAGGSLKSLKDNAKFKETADVGVDFHTDTVGVAIGAGLAFLGITLSKKAEGGFVDTGELFVAREAGPELVGRINGRTAVANNDQIVSGISSGVYQAVRSAMNGYGGNGNFNINATFMMDSEVVGKQIIKYHNGVVKRTGNTPLLV